MIELENYVAGLRISQGEGAGGPFVLLPWQKRLLRGAFAPSVQTAAVSVGRGNGKTTLFAATAAAAVDGPLVRPRGETVVVASSFGQSRILFEHARAFLAPVLDTRWRRAGGAFQNSRFGEFGICRRSVDWRSASVHRLGPQTRAWTSAVVSSL